MATPIKRTRKNIGTGNTVLTEPTSKTSQKSSKKKIEEEAEEFLKSRKPEPTQKKTPPSVSPEVIYRAAAIAGLISQGNTLPKEEFKAQVEAFVELFRDT